ncbi:MAG: hypothetical protein HY687_02540 [Chloroflexi bacterium]|nr:hypothetical protein [Chloroflexota bacterium]
MVLQRLVFQAKYGKANDLVAHLKKGGELYTKHGLDKGRVLTDLTGSMFTVVWETSLESIGAFEKARPKMFADPAFGPWFAQMQSLVEKGTREFYTIE